MPHVNLVDAVFSGMGVGFVGLLLVELRRGAHRPTRGRRSNGGHRHE